jgi:hypothetical protein
LIEYQLTNPRITFKLDENHWLTLIPDEEFSSQAKITANYTKPLKNGELAHYKKKIERK